MAPTKRTAAAQTPSTPTKKGKHQSSLTAFFTSPSKRTAPVVQDDVGSCHPAVLTQQESDELLAIELAAQEAGIGVEEFRARLKHDREVGAFPHRDSVTIEASHQVYPSPSVTNNDIPISKSVQAETKPSVTKPSAVDLDAMDTSIYNIPLAQDILSFDPYQIDTSTWPTILFNDGKSLVATTPYALLIHCLVQISATRSRLAITTLLTNLLRTVRVHDPDSLLPTVYLVSNHIAPDYDGVELGLGSAIVTRAIKQVTGKSSQALKLWWEKTGDLGDVAYEAKKDVKVLIRPSPMTVQKLFTTLHVIARLSGQGSTTQKLGYVTKLLVASRGQETRFLVRTFHSNLHIQAVRTTITTSLARAFALVETRMAEIPLQNDKQRENAHVLLVTPQEREGVLAHPAQAKQKTDPRRIAIMAKLARAEKLVREVRARHPNFGVIVPTLLSIGLAGLSERVPLRVGTPISPMLGSITRSLTVMHEKLGPRAFVSEFKYDGQRCQIHAIYIPCSAGSEARKRAVEAHDGIPASSGKGGKWVGKDGQVYVRLFSRHLEEMTEKYPDITDMVPILVGQQEQEEEEGAAFRELWKDGVDAAEEHNDGQVQQAADIKAGTDCDAGPSNRTLSNPKTKVTSLIMDAEVVAIGPQGELLPFQTLVNRSRKDVNLQNVKVKVGVFAFDLMYLDGESLLKSSFRARRNLLHTRFQPLSPSNPLIARFAHVQSCLSNDPEQVARFFAASQENRCEGIMVKSLDHHWESAAARLEEGDDEEQPVQRQEEGETLDGFPREGRLEKLADVVEDELTMENEDEAGTDGCSSKQDGTLHSHLCAGQGVNGRSKALLSTYEPDKRCESWLKVKKDYVDGLGDSLDLVPIGAWHGMGRKATWWSPILLALYDPETGGFQAVCKCISGFTDAFYKELNVRFAQGGETCLPAQSSPPPPFGYECETGNLLPDVWWKPTEVWEIRGADITISPTYTAAIGLVTDERGLSIRFPRFVRRRPDKSLEQASTPACLAKLYFDQQKAAPPKPVATWSE